jgi:membrane-associated protease RseP (regulator of RpoE activity)
MGIITSIVFLVYGIQMTLLADPETLKFFPALPVADLKLSTLGVGIMDYLFGGAGVITSQDPSTMIALHPFAIAGFAGLFIQSLEMMPLGSTDGGRMSQAIFGRSGHLVVGGGAWFVLLVATLFIDQSGDILLGAWVVNNVSQNDMEIPCRNEVETADVFRSIAGFGLWFIAILALVPMQ